MEQTFFTAGGFAILILISSLVLLSSRENTIIPIIIAQCYLTMGQSIVIGGINFTVFRIIILFCWIRIIIRREWTGFRFNNLDKVIILWGLVGVVTYALLWQTTSAFVYKSGALYNAFGFYFYFRIVLRDYNFEDIIGVFKKTSIIIIPLAILMVNESYSGNNLFSALGGVANTSVFREGSFRSQGPFQHSILAGTLGATLLPILLALWWQNRRFIPFGLGVLGSLLILWTSGSTGPILAGMAGIGAIFLWPARYHIKKIRWLAVIVLIGLHFLMKAPVWFLPARLAEIFGGSGWYRSYLIDRAIFHFDEWWFIGTKHAADWMPFQLGAYSDQADITNQYVGQGIHGGAITLVLFIAIILIGFKMIGNLVFFKYFGNGDKLIFWGLGASLFAHTVSFISIAYFDQIIISWYLLLAVISILSNFRKNISKAEECCIGI